MILKTCGVDVSFRSDKMGVGGGSSRRERFVIHSFSERVTRGCHFGID